MLDALKQTIYIKVMRDSFELLHVQNNQTLHQSASQPFSTPRLAVGQFNHAEEALGAGIKALLGAKRLLLAPEVIMHQLYLADGGLSQVEERLLKELAMSVGARKVHIWQGHTLSREQLLQGVYMSPART